jgi:hypothetical protein
MCVRKCEIGKRTVYLSITHKLGLQVYAHISEITSFQRTFRRLSGPV